MRLSDAASYVVASGDMVPNQGKQVPNLCTPQGDYEQLQFQLAPVAQVMCSVSGLCKACNSVIFEDGYGYIEDKRTKYRTWLKEKEGLYVLDHHVAPSNEQVFSRQA